MNHKIMFIALIALMMLIAMPAQAGTITLSHPGTVENRDVMVYWANGTVYGLYNLTSTITIQDGTSYMFTLVPQTTGVLDDPGTWLTTVAFPFVVNNAIALVVIMLLIGLLGRK